MQTFTDQELASERKRAEMLGDLCTVHGRADGAVAHRATAAAITEEQSKRSRGSAG
jgi:hypothetical protein